MAWAHLIDDNSVCDDTDFCPYNVHVPTHLAGVLAGVHLLGRNDFSRISTDIDKTYSRCQKRDDGINEWLSPRIVQDGSCNRHWMIHSLSSFVQPGRCPLSPFQFRPKRLWNDRSGSRYWLQYIMRRMSGMGLLHQHHMRSTVNSHKARLSNHGNTTLGACATTDNLKNSCLCKLTEKHKPDDPPCATNSSRDKYQSDYADMALLGHHRVSHGHGTGISPGRNHHHQRPSYHY